MNSRPAAFLDRDGLLNEEPVPDRESGLPESPLHVADVRLVPGAAGSLERLARAGFALMCVSNQPAAAKGTASLGQLEEVHDRVLELLAREGAEIEASRMCLHHPDGVVPELAGPCGCRKPAPGMLLDLAAEHGLALEDSWMIGDTDADVGAGRAAGCRTALVEHPGSVHKRTRTVRPDVLAPELSEAVTQLLDLRSR